MLKSVLEVHDWVSIAFRHSPRSRHADKVTGLFEAGHCLHCLSAFTTFPTWQSTVNCRLLSCSSPLPFGIHHVPDGGERHGVRRADGGSPLPFGIHHVPDGLLPPSTGWPSRCLHCLSAFTTFPTAYHLKKAEDGLVVSIAFRHSPRSRHAHGKLHEAWADFVSIAFRHSPRSRRLAARRQWHPARDRLHCLSAFTTFPTRSALGLLAPRTGSLHCLSAFTTFPTGGAATRGGARVAGLHCLSAFTTFPTAHGKLHEAWADFGLHCLSAFTTFPTCFHGRERRVHQTEVSIAFRHSPRSRPTADAADKPAEAPAVSIAFRHSPRSRPPPAGRSCGLGLVGLHCLSAFTTFPTSMKR